MSSYEVGKRILDIIAGIVGVIIFSPLMLGAAIYIKIVSPDGPLYADIPLRVGKNGKLFRMFKFRSMIPHATDWLFAHPDIYKQYQQNDYKLDQDPRLLKGINFLRKSSIDELPQFFNVLMGQMSLVGYRAYYQYELEEQLNKYPEAIPYLEKALSVKPGITGVWQVSGRSQVSFKDRIKMDAEYADKKSLLYDFIIILKTPLAVLSGKGAK
jgi:lipopolysaccharide/colanic/teichoic acid biosynthesis glycosyltransferase